MSLAVRSDTYLFASRGQFCSVSPHTTQDADLFVERSPENGRALVEALGELGFALHAEQRLLVPRTGDWQGSMGRVR